MRLSSVATLLFAFGVSALPEPDNVVIVEGEYTYKGIDKPLLALRSLESRCSCFPCYSGHADCTPGKCQCAGDNGCWSCNGGRTQCQPGPGSGQCWT
ncbi:hypothetical protein B0J13DRAFT_590453 [Dactylonectria estremocensis]|uniref:Uncharacterized protein n=1 Tax=Dactylonectria estremocensis TaxID=1079267 RepID=A0A9P9DAN9_9HYPO|nr:hypothetical protein B0J13DRAFT_590453 [Dactylonectria estremocensis]